MQYETRRYTEAHVLIPLTKTQHSSAKVEGESAFCHAHVLIALNSHFSYYQRRMTVLLLHTFAVFLCTLQYTTVWGGDVQRGWIGVLCRSPCYHIFSMWQWVNAFGGYNSAHHVRLGVLSSAKRCSQGLSFTGNVWRTNIRQILGVSPGAFRKNQRKGNLAMQKKH